MRELPSFYDPERVDRIYLERTAQIAAEASAHLPLPSSEDKLRIAAFGIDVQIGFCIPGASLFAPGAVEDTRRSAEWIYRNLEKITQTFFSLDTHSPLQIFHPSWWKNKEGHAPPPLTVITAADILEGRWIPTRDPQKTLAYCQTLEEKGRYLLTIWPYHTLQGGLEHALTPSIMEAALYHGFRRNTAPRMLTKGSHPNTENYSVFSPEVTEIQGETVGRFEASFFAELMTFDRIYVFGQASSHCVLSTLRDLQDKIMETNPAWIRKIFILEDAMSPVPAPPLDPLPEGLNFPLIAEQALKDFENAGMNLVKTTDAL